MRIKNNINTIIVIGVIILPIIVSSLIYSIPNPQIYELKYVVSSIPGKLAESRSFVAGRCAYRFEAQGLKQGTLRLELDLIPRNVTGSYHLEGESVEITPSKNEEPLWTCVTADNITVDVKVVGRKGDDTLVELTVVFTGFKAITKLPAVRRSKFLGLYESVLGTPTYVKGDTAVWVEKEYRITRHVVVKNDGEAYDLENGVWLGEWVFWRRPWSISTEPRLILAAVNYGLPYIGKNSSGFTAFLAYIGGAASEGYSLRVNGEPLSIGAKDIVTGYTVPLPFVSAVVPREPSLQAERLLGVFGCTVKKEAKVEIRCDTLLDAYEKSKAEKPWRLTIFKRSYGGATWSFVEIHYRGLTLAPYPMDVYRLAYWKDTGILLYMGEDTALAGPAYGYAPPPLTGYIHVNRTAVVFAALDSPLALKLVEARVSTSTSASPVTAGQGYVFLAALVLAVAVAPLALVVRWAYRHKS